MTVEEIKMIQSEKSVLSEETFSEVFEEENEFTRQQLIEALREKASELKCKKKFDELLNAYKRFNRQIVRQQKQNELAEMKRGPKDNMTEFDYFDDGHELCCGAWTADKFGVIGHDIRGDYLACYHPILIAKRLLNVQTGKEKVRIAFQKGLSDWKEITVDKGIIASSSKIVQLADFGISVTSESAKYLVKYFADIENLNIDKIDFGFSTSKFGWIEDRFSPYDKEIEFDAEKKFPEICNALQPKGKYSEWLKLVRELRQSDRYEVRLYLAGAFASILLKPLNVLPFILNLWGETGKGKTVALMVAASVWADPSENRYITDPVSSQVAIEVRENLLNNMPIMIDDLSKTRDKYADGFTDLIYMLCGGKGKDRSNVDLGLNNGTSWQNICLTNIERPLAADTMRGGAINRILDFEMEEGSIFENGNHIVSVVSKNYGFAGEIFVRIIQNMYLEDIKQMQQDFLQKINDRAREIGQEKEEKQTIPLSVLLTADKIATDEIFEDGRYLDLNMCVDSLKGKGDVSENERAYDYIMSDVAINYNRFAPDEEGNYKGECWGKFQDDYVIIISNAFDKIAERGNFSRKMFCQWAKKRGLLQLDAEGKSTKSCRFDFGNPRCIWLKKPDEMDGFQPVDFDLPFE